MARSRPWKAQHRIHRPDDANSARAGPSSRVSLAWGARSDERNYLLAKTKDFRVQTVVFGAATQTYKPHIVVLGARCHTCRA
jgi:hypothetical protein